jgi:hypothetical protein
MSARRIARVLGPILVAVVLGPLVAGIAVWLFAIASNLSDPATSLPFADFGGLLVLYVIMAYFIGGPVALLAGLLVSLWMIRRPPNVLVVNAAAVIATGVFMGIAALGVLGPVEENHGRSNFLFTLALAVVSANICWLLMRRFAQRDALAAG